MTAVCTEWARRHGAVRLAAPDRARPVFTAARARGETPAVAVQPWWVSFWVPSVAATGLERSAQTRTPRALSDAVKTI